MPESLNNRIRFHKRGTQKNYILKAKDSVGLKWYEFAQKLNISPRTLTDWKREKIDISEISAEEISRLTGVPIPKDHTIIDWRVHFQNAGKIGGRNKFLKYGRVSTNEKYRKESWRKWWSQTGQYKGIPNGFNSIIKIKIPNKSKLLAEFIGILLGDGHISKYQVGITLSIEENDYIKYVKLVIEKLFGVTPAVFRHKKTKAITIVVSRKLLVDFCQEFGFERGNKIMHQVDIPEWIKRSRIFSKECVRGLIDTDGCFFMHNYKVNGKKYSYLKIAFTSASAPLRLSVEKFLINSRFIIRTSKVRQGNRGRDIRIDDAKSVDKYIKEIGTHNHKHQEKIDKWLCK